MDDVHMHLRDLWRHTEVLSFRNSGQKGEGEFKTLLIKNKGKLRATVWVNMVHVVQLFILFLLGKFEKTFEGHLL